MNECDVCAGGSGSMHECMHANTMRDKPAEYTDIALMQQEAHGSSRRFNGQEGVIEAKV